MFKKYLHFTKNFLNISKTEKFFDKYSIVCFE